MSQTPSPMGSPPPVMKPHRGTMVLVFGILGICCCFILAILAWVFGHCDLKEMREGRMDRTGESNTRAGMILGIIGCAIHALWMFGFGALRCLHMGGRLFHNNWVC